jgi:hypothetical protein
MEKLSQLSNERKSIISPPLVEFDSLGIDSSLLNRSLN